MSKITPIRPPGAGPSSAGAEPPPSVRPEPVEGPAHNADATNVPKYWAFLSYSHHDKLIARRLQKQLETYRVPRRLVGRETSHGPVPARVAPVFRDRDELHAGADLKASVQDALSKSRWLIVVCTPDAARSPWVNREIIEFKKLHGERRVLALIARGEPFASDMPGREAEECFPPALRRALNDQGVPEGELLEPIAADMRKHGDGPQRATLKLLAGMLGVSFDDLVRRDMQRRVRLLSAVAGASVLGLVAFAFLAVMAVQARNEAQHQRVQAEGLIEFMLGDLRKKLEPVGRLEVLDSVGEKALAYYGAQESGNLDATALGHRSRAMHLIGEIRDLRGNPVEAQKAFEQAAETTAQLLAQTPNDGQRIFDHAQSVFWVGYAAWKRTDGKTAEHWFSEYLQLAERLRTMNPANLDWVSEVAFAHVNLGMVQLGSGRPNVALQSLDRANEILASLVAKRPELGFDLVNSYGWQASAHEMLGNFQMALEKQKKKLELLKATPNAKDSRTVQRGIASSVFSIGMYELSLGRVEQAEVNVAEAFQLSDVLVAADPQNIKWLGDHCLIQLGLAEVRMFLGRQNQAQQNLVGAERCVTQYNASGSTGFRDATLLNARALALSAQLRASGRPGDLSLDMERFLAKSVDKVSAETLDRTKVVQALASVAVELGRIYERQPDLLAAQRAWRHAEALLAPIAETNAGGVITLLAQVRLHNGDVAGAKLLVEQVRSTSYRHPGFADLAKELRSRGGNES